MSPVGQPERATQDRVVSLVRDPELGYERTGLSVTFGFTDPVDDPVTDPCIDWSVSWENRRWHHPISSDW